MSSKAREALLAVYDCAKDGVLTIRENAFEKVLEALKEPVRNCDVGTAEEQAKRMDKFCNSHRHGFDGRCSYACENCKFISMERCELAWGQMPYEKEVTK